jgi:hypothetical protein
MSIIERTKFRDAALLSGDDLEDRIRLLNPNPKMYSQNLLRDPVERRIVSDAVFLNFGLSQGFAVTKSLRGLVTQLSSGI